jgi:dTDP-4-amino-4,6-dideoxygalactose transaminase
MYAMGKQELRAVGRVLQRRRFFRYGGAETAAVERAWAVRTGAKSAIAVTSGTGALVCALQAMRIGPGSSVLVPAYTFVSTALAVTAVGAIPIYVEIDETLTMCPADLERKMRKHTACVIPVHMQGIPCEMRAIRRIARRHGARVLEDACQAAGGSYNGRPLGSLGDMGAFSFNQYKIISCGEGGAVVTSNAKLAERAFMAQDGSCSVWPETGAMSEAFFCGGSYRFNEINAALLRVQIGRLDGILKRLRHTRGLFMAGLRPPEGFRLVRTHDEDGNCGVCFLIQAPTVAAAMELEAGLKDRLGVHRPINSGRHVYSAWGVVNSRIGGHHPDWDCFRHPRNRAIRTHYDRPLRRTDDILARTLLVHTPWDWPEARVRRVIAELNRTWRGNSAPAVERPA